MSSILSFFTSITDAMTDSYGVKRSFVARSSKAISRNSASGVDHRTLRTRGGAAELAAVTATAAVGAAEPAVMAPADAGIGDSGVIDDAVGTTSAGVSVCGIAGMAGRSGSSENGRCATLRTFSQLMALIFRFRGGTGANVIGRVTIGMVLAA